MGGLNKDPKIGKPFKKEKIYIFLIIYFNKMILSVLVIITILCICSLIINLAMSSDVNTNANTSNTSNKNDPCIINIDSQNIIIPPPWYKNPNNPKQCLAPPFQKCCNQVSEGCMQNFENHTVDQIQKWVMTCLNG